MSAFYNEDVESSPLLRDDRNVAYAADNSFGSESVPGYIDEFDSNDTSTRTARPQGASVVCRVCDQNIALEGRTGQHVIKCYHCEEATPIRPAPAGKKYVRCPCNCLLICKASSTRIACPRNNCRRVITLAGQREPVQAQGSAIRAPTGSCRVTCVHCNEVFLFNTLNNSLATCPHCRKNSTVGGFARRRAMMFLATTIVLALLTVLFTALTSTSGQQHFYIYIIVVFLALCTLTSFYKFIKYWMIKMSTVIGPM